MKICGISMIEIRKCIIQCLCVFNIQIFHRIQHMVQPTQFKHMEWNGNYFAYDFMTFASDKVSMQKA
jgi:hypothetical protein